MKDRIRKIMADNHLSPAEFAEKIGVGKPNISHIMGERNKPGMPIITKICEAFPSISVEWLVMGRGDMYKKDADIITNTSKIDLNYKLDFDDIQATEEPSDLLEEESVQYRRISPLNVSGSDNNVNIDDFPNEPLKAQTHTHENKQESVNVAHTVDMLPKFGHTDKKINKIIIYYSDNTFMAFNPTEADF